MPLVSNGTVYRGSCRFNSSTLSKLFSQHWSDYSPVGASYKVGANNLVQWMELMWTFEGRNNTNKQLWPMVLKCIFCFCYFLFRGGGGCSGFNTFDIFLLWCSDFSCYHSMCKCIKIQTISLPTSKLRGSKVRWYEDSSNTWSTKKQLYW